MTLAVYDFSSAQQHWLPGAYLATGSVLPTDAASATPTGSQGGSCVHRTRMECQLHRSSCVSAVVSRMRLSPCSNHFTARMSCS